ncbi:MAG: ribosome biogenesis GTPase YlqF [Clostridia bacterium]|nr:ribosome biogenesis GTPase YlqF [Clostridia bacterium]
MQLQWFPGHMAKTRRMITENLKLVDVVIELVDARLPLASRNPEIDKIVKNKPRIIVLNKCDMADEETNKKWIKYFRDRNLCAMLADSQSGFGVKERGRCIETVLKEKFLKDEARGIQRHAVRMMIVGIPNVGKSSFINRISGRAATKTGDRPGITQTKQWIRIAGKYELLDTPGILWPKFEDPLTARKIAYTGGIKDEIIDVEELAFFLLKFLQKYYSEMLDTRYKIENTEDFDAYDLLEEIGRKRGCMISGGNVDMMRASNLVLDDFRSARIGRISLETPPEK